MWALLGELGGGTPLRQVKEGYGGGVFLSLSLYGGSERTCRGLISGDFENHVKEGSGDGHLSPWGPLKRGLLHRGL
jgi:hypothetical protein